MACGPRITYGASLPGMFMDLRCTLAHEKSTKGSFSLPLTLSPKGRGDFRGNDEQGRIVIPAQAGIQGEPSVLLSRNCYAPTQGLKPVSQKIKSHIYSSFAQNMSTKFIINAGSQPHRLSMDVPFWPRAHARQLVTCSRQRFRRVGNLLPLVRVVSIDNRGALFVA